MSEKISLDSSDFIYIFIKEFIFDKFTIQHW